MFSASVCTLAFIFHRYNQHILIDTKNHNERVGIILADLSSSEDQGAVWASSFQELEAG